MSNKNQPFYHLRPNKYIDRQMFISVLEALNNSLSLLIKDYNYIGFGSYYFDDFIDLHKKLNIDKLVSLESDSEIFKRAKFNKPYRCIDIENIRSDEYIEEIENSHEKEQFIIWFDYTSPGAIGEQFSDFCNLLSVLQANDIVRITLNANPKALDQGRKIDQAAQQEAIREERLETLRNRIANYLPSNANQEMMKYQNYPILLLMSLRNAALSVMQPTQFDKLFLFPLFANAYADGQQMLTFTAIVLDNEDDKVKIIEATSHLNFMTYDWEKVYSVSVPSITTREYNFLNQFLPMIEPEERKKIMEITPFFDESEIIAFGEIYKYYPNFHHVNL